MGLDCYFAKSVGPGETAKPVVFEDPQPALCGGMFSGHDSDGSFRGKVYSDGVERITGQSLYEKITPFQLLEMADSIQDWLDENPDAKDWHDPGRTDEDWGYWPIKREELVDLERCFRAYGEAGYGCYAWY